jgi:hypothetical protein
MLVNFVHVLFVDIYFVTEKFIVLILVAKIIENIIILQKWKLILFIEDFNIKMYFMFFKKDYWTTVMNIDIFLYHYKDLFVWFKMNLLNWWYITIKSQLSNFIFKDLQLTTAIIMKDHTEIQLTPPSLISGVNCVSMGSFIIMGWVYHCYVGFLFKMMGLIVVLWDLWVLSVWDPSLELVS